MICARVFVRQVKLWNVESKECAMGFKGHNAEVSTIAYHAFEGIASFEE